MSLRNPNNRYGRLSIALHWLMLLLIAGVYIAVEMHSNYPKGSEPRALLMKFHFMLGLTVFTLVWLRIVARLLVPAPGIQPPLPGWQNVLAKAMHLALYALMIGMPLAGWMVLSAGDKPVPFWGLELPHLIGKDPDLAKQIKEVHETVGVIGYWLIGLHAAAALFHHFVTRDNTLVRMLPGRE
ncbi:hypothetical protein D3C76_1082560 [compost metagenome]|uniref:Cytochrome b561 n=1 Tax=Pseudomonas jinjuensis TaxID=198616 RepID=A0A1H0A380_9PSED|nr:cytochrome b [Pseudomonas jinjuensis]SDN27443.1 cytochrome b561 [Pseudomonas jinjuensis]